MILREFHNGWGDDVQLRRFEKQIIRQYLSPWYQDKVRSVVVNSTWYTEEFHADVMAWIKTNSIDRIALVSLLDPAIPKAEWFGESGAEIRSVGYYKGHDTIDAWVLIMDRYFQMPVDPGNADDIDTTFLCYNRKPHQHRRNLLSQLHAHGCMHNGIVTMGAFAGRAALQLFQDVPSSDLAPNSGPEQYGIANDIMSLGAIAIWKRCFMNIVTETVFDIDREWFVSEKIYKPMLGRRPFLVYAPNGAQSWLHHWGFVDFIQDFDDITDLDLAYPDNIAPFLVTLANQSQNYLKQKYLALEPKISYNFDRFWQHVDSTKQRLAMSVSP